MTGLMIFIGLLVLGYLAGSYAENKHYHSIKEREDTYLHLPVVTVEDVIDAEKEVATAQLVSGNVVVSIDYFKRFLAALRNLFGGRIRSYETLIDRGRREAVLRMKAQVPTADLIVNMRIETSIIGKSANQKNSLGSIEVLAYGTALNYKVDNEVRSKKK